MPRQAKTEFIEKDLTKGQIRKLTALRKSLGENIANKAFAQWLATIGSGQAEEEDKNAILIGEALAPLLKANKLKIPRGGYLVRRGRGRVIIERAVLE